MNFIPKSSEKELSYLRGNHDAMLTHRGNLLQPVFREEEEKPGHLTECCVVPGVDWATGTQKKVIIFSS